MSSNFEQNLVVILLYQVQELGLVLILFPVREGILVPVSCFKYVHLEHEFLVGICLAQLLLKPLKFFLNPLLVAFLLFVIKLETVEDE